MFQKDSDLYPATIERIFKIKRDTLQFYWFI